MPNTSEDGRYRVLLLEVDELVFLEPEDPGRVATDGCAGDGHGGEGDPSHLLWTLRPIDAALKKNEGLGACLQGPVVRIEELCKRLRESVEGREPKRL